MIKYVFTNKMFDVDSAKNLQIINLQKERRIKIIKTKEKFQKIRKFTKAKKIFQNKIKIKTKNKNKIKLIQ